MSLQACRGGKFDYGVDSEATDGPVHVDMASKEVYNVHTAMCMSHGRSVQLF